MTRFPVPPSPKREVISVEFFRGVDLNNASSNVDIHRSPEAPNMMRDEVGKVRKRTGFEVTTAYAGKRINGVFMWGGGRLVHAGGELFGDGEEPLYTGMADNRSRAWRFGGRLYIQDGIKFLAYDGETVKPVEDDAYVPTIIISRNPGGGGTTLEPLNLLGRKWTESFLGAASITAYQLTTDNLGADEVKAEKLNSSGVWQALKEKADFTVNRTTGRVTFSVAPGVSPITGQDNVRITAAKTREGYADRINRCGIGAVYGVNGSPDRLFVSGDPEHPNLDYYSQMNDPTYFGDTWYSALGQDGAEIIGYSVVGNLLAAHKKESGDGRNIVLRAGVMEGEGSSAEAAFPIVSALQGEGAIGKHAFGYLGSEPLFLTSLGIYAITSAELTGDRYAQQRDFYVSPALQAEDGLEEAFGYVWRDFYLLAVNTRVYLLDGLQKTYETGAPYSTFQYECYYWTGIDARVMWEEDGALCFGTSGGMLCRFYKDADRPASYNDAGKPIKAYWDTPDIGGDSFYRNKTFRFLAVRLASAVLTGLRVYAQKKGIWSLLYDAKEKARYLDWGYIDFSKLVFSSDRTPKTHGGKIKLKKVDKVRFRLLNEALDEPFGVYALALEYTEGNYYKG